MFMFAIAALPLVKASDPAGVTGRYYDLGAVNSLPDFSGMEPVVIEHYDNINFGRTGGSWVGSLYRDTVGAVFDGCISITESGNYIFYTNSDDGSKLYVRKSGDADYTLVVNNDGLHPMQERQGTIYLEARTKIDLKVEFFEKHGDKGIIALWTPPNSSKAVIPASAFVSCGGGEGDPHMKTWVGEKYDFHGVCDLVMLSNPGFDNGRGMHIHIRNKRTRVWSYISTAAVSIGKATLQIVGGADSNKYFLNGVEQDADSNNSAGILDNFAGHKLEYQRISDVSVEYRVALKSGSSIVFKTWNGLVSVKMYNPLKEDFDGSLGLLGSYPNGAKLARDNVTIISDSNMFGQEWQVIDTEPKLFNEGEGPQFPAKCDIPDSSDMRRRLASSSITIETANTACASVGADEKDLCIFDVLATNNIESAGAY